MVPRNRNHDIILNDGSNHGGKYRPPFSQCAGRVGDRNRRQGIHVRGRAPAVRSPARLSRHGRRFRNHLPLLLDALPARSGPRPACGASRGMRAPRGGQRLIRARRRSSVASSRTVIVAGAGIGGLAVALALAKKGFRAAVFEQSARLEEIGAGIQLSPNALHALFALGLEDALRPHVVAPENVCIRKAGSGRELAQVPLGAHVEARYGAPYWTIHRGDLQKVLLDAVRANPDIALMLGVRVEDFAVHAHGVTAQARSGAEITEERGIGLVGADGLGSAVRVRLGHKGQPVFQRRTAWRAVVGADAVPEEFRAARVNLWFGRDSHLVHYPVKAGTHINIVAIVRDQWPEAGWDNAGSREELLSRFSRWSWAASARALLAA